MRDDISVPDLPPNGSWINGDPGKMPVATAKGPVLVHFFDFSQLNSVRSLPYLIEWNRKYSPFGLKVIGVQVPRFPFGGEEDAVAAGLARLEVGFPVMIDRDRILQTSYGFEGWPSLFLWGRGGILRWFHFGEGEYRGTEEAIQESLRAAGKAAPAPGEEVPEGLPEGLPDLPGLMEPVRATDAEGARLIPPGEELFLVEGRPWTRAEDDGGFDIEYEAAGIHATVSGRGSLLLTLDGEPLEPVGIDGPGLYTLAEHGEHGAHRIAVELEGDPGIWSVSFTPALAP